MLYTIAFIQRMPLLWRLIFYNCICELAVLSIYSVVSSRF